MIKTKQFNNVPDSMIPKLGRDEVAVFVCLHNSVGPGGVPLYPTYGIAPIATIMTPDGPAEIANVIEAAPEGRMPRMGDVIFETSQKGTIICKGSSPSDIRKFEFLSLHPENEANGGSTFRREIPGQRQKSALDKAKLEADAINFALDTPINILKSLLKERNIKLDGKSDDEIRVMATTEGKRKPFEVKANLLDERTVATITEMAEVEVIKWDPTTKGLFNINTETRYPVEVKKNGTVVEKTKQMIGIAQRDAELAEILLADVKAYDEL